MVQHRINNELVVNRLNAAKKLSIRLTLAAILLISPLYVVSNVVVLFSTDIIVDLKQKGCGLKHT